MRQPLVAALAAFAFLAGLAGGAAVLDRDPDPVIPTVAVGGPTYTVSAPCDDPVVLVPGLAEPFRPGGSSFTVGAGTGTLVVYCPVSR